MKTKWSEIRTYAGRMESVISMLLCVSPLTVNPVSAADIATVMDRPGTFAWMANCGAFNGPGGTSQIAPCAGGSCNLTRVTIDTGDFPHAVCADGSPGVFYVRPGTGDDINKWVLHLQGGGNCKTYEDCRARWCGTQGNLPYTANKMSSDFNGDGNIDLLLRGKAAGMVENAPGNRFSSWNHVFFYYCSSDSWQGRANDVPYTDPAGVNDFTINQRGHTILSAARRMLRKNNTNPAWSADDRTTIMPDLDSADVLLFTGTSAGALGAIQNADWFLAPLPAEDKRLVIDANIDMTDEVLANHDVWVDLDGDGNGDTTWDTYRVDMSLDSWNNGWDAAVNAFVDESCRLVNEPVGRLDRCSYKGVLLWSMDNGVPFLETPTFIRQDLEDEVIGKRWAGAWPTGENLMLGQFGRATTFDDFTTLARESLTQIFAGAGRSVSGIFSPRCGSHVGLESSPVFATHTTPDTFYVFGNWLSVGAATSVHDALWDWYSMSAPIRYLDTADVNDPTVQNNPVTDPVVQFSMGRNCQY